MSRILAAGSLFATALAALLDLNGEMVSLEDLQAGRVEVTEPATFIVSTTSGQKAKLLEETEGKFSGWEATNAMSEKMPMFIGTLDQEKIVWLLQQPAVKYVESDGVVHAAKKDHEQEDSNYFRKGGPEPAKFIKGVPVFNYHEVHGGARERKGVDMASLGEVEGEQKSWIIVLSPNTSDADLEDLCKNRGCDSIETSSGGLKVVFFTGTETEVTDMIEQASVTVLYIELDSEFIAIPDVIGTDQSDPQATPWGLTRIGASGRGAHAGLGATVFVLDTGVLVTHTEFNGRVVPGCDSIKFRRNLTECNGDLTCAQDDNGHGTHCAGTAAGQTVGVAPGARVISVKVLTYYGGAHWEWVWRGVDWMARTQDRPAVGSMSLGGKGYGYLLESGIDSAVANGVTVVVAAGNQRDDSCLYTLPSIESAITVSATDPADKRAFANYGSCVDILAPGDKVVSAWNTSTTAYKVLYGTSMATPHVSGVVALVLELNKNATPAEVRDELLFIAEKGAISGLDNTTVNVLVSARRLPCSA